MRIIIKLVMAFLLLACREKEKDTFLGKIEKEEKVDGKDYWEKNKCLRGIPTSTLYSKDLKKYSFELKEDRGIEIAVWKNGDSLLIENRGCEVFGLTYNFYVNNADLQEDHIELVRYCFARVEEISLAPIDLKGGIRRLDKMKVKGENLELGFEHFLKEDNVSEMFEIDEIDLKINSSTVTFSFAIGNL